jgi:hypothetical protein
MSDKPNYDDVAYLIIVGDYGCCNRLSKIIDSIHLNGCTGHSFGVTLWQDDKPVMKAGGFDGDGADRVDFICAGEYSEKILNFDMVSSNIKCEETISGSNKGDCVLIVKGTFCGIDAITEIVKNADNMATVTKERVDVKTDDKPEIECGRLWYFMEENPFGFAIVTVQDGPWRDPIKLFLNKGYSVMFFRGQID